MSIFHITTRLGRSDTFHVEAVSLSSLLSFFQMFSNAVIGNVKEVLFSKEFNVNYVQKNYIQSDVWQRVYIHALSENKAKTFTLYNIKRTVTQQMIINQFKKLYIEDEPIIDFSSIIFYEEGSSPIDIQNLYQVQYKRRNKTCVESFHAPSWQVAYEVAEELIDGEITEVRKYVHFDDTVLNSDNLNSYKAINVYMSSSDSYRSFKIPYAKHTLNQNTLKENISQTFKVSNQNIDSKDVRLTFK